MTIKGEASLLRKLTIIPERMREQIKAVMAEQAEEIVEMMRRLVPVEPGKPDLKATIGWRWGRKAPKGAQAVATVGSEQRSDLTITIYAGDNETFYATFVEFGTAERSQKSGKSTGKMPAHPFFFVSWRANRKGAKNKIRAAVRKAAKQVAAGG